MNLDENFIEELRAIYAKYAEYNTDSFTDVIEYMVKNFESDLKQTHIEGKILNIISSKYPQYIYRWENMGDGGRWLRIYNVEEEKEDKLEEEVYTIFNNITTNGEFDIMHNIVNKEITKAHYSHLLENKEIK